MIHGPTMPSGQALFCDDVRQEVSNKLIYIGVYIGEIGFRAVAPVSMPQLYVPVIYLFNPAALPEKIVTRVEFVGLSGAVFTLIEDDQTLAAQAEQGPNKPIENGLPVAQLFRLLRIAQPTFPEPGRIRVRGVFDGEEHRIGALDVSINPPIQPDSDAQ